jgi:hypothetical protein
MQQALDRLRLIHNEEPKLIFILSSVPLPIPVDLLIPRQDITDALRFVRLLEAAKTRGLATAVLSKTWLHSAFPEEWDTEKAAENG